MLETDIILANLLGFGIALSLVIRETKPQTRNSRPCAFIVRLLQQETESTSSIIHQFGPLFQSPPLLELCYSCYFLRLIKISHHTSGQPWSLLTKERCSHLSPPPSYSLPQARPNIFEFFSAPFPTLATSSHLPLHLLLHIWYRTFLRLPDEGYNKLGRTL